MNLKNKIFISLLISLIFVFITEYFFHCFNAHKILYDLSISAKTICLIIIFSLIIAYFLFGYKKDGKCKYILSVVLFYAIYYIISHNQVFTHELFKLPVMILLVIILISLFGLYHLVKNYL